MSDTREDFDTLADSIVAFALALKKAGLALDSTDATMRNSGVTPDPYVLRAKYMALVEMKKKTAWNLNWPSKYRHGLSVRLTLTSEPCKLETKFRRKV